MVMKVLLVGDGARENMLAEQLARSSELYVAMEKRNPGIERFSNKFFVCDYSNIEAIGGWAVRENIDVALITSETALAKGMSDAISDCGLKLASPPGSGTVLGENTLYALNLMKAAGIAAPRFRSCSNEKELKSAMKEMRSSIIKPSVKVEWKGTRFGETDLRKPEDMVRYGKQMIKRQGSVVVEEFIDGETFSLQGITDGKSLSVMPPVHIAKRLEDGNKGELTEGMGGFSSGRLLPFMRQDELDKARESLMRLVTAMKGKGTDYRGPIRGEFIITKSGLLMLDAYATFGDIDTLNNLLLLRSQLGEAIISVTEGSLKQLIFQERATVIKYLVPKGYPGKPKKSQIIIDERALWNQGAKVCAESVVMDNKGMWTSKGRSIAICASGGNLAEAESKAEDAAMSVKGELQHRKDIGTADYVNRAIKHLALLRSA